MGWWSWRTSSARDSDAETEHVDLSDVDLESGLDDEALTTSDLAFGRPPAEKRRQMERELVLRCDTRELNRGEAWFLIEAPWLDAWMTYILSEEDPDCPVTKPGPLTNTTLFDPKEYCLKKDLEPTKHYRGVNPMVYAIYAELYGTAGAKPIARWTLDIYATPVMIDDVKEMLRGPELKARVEVDKINELFDTSDRTDHSREEGLLYRCCCRCEFLIPCLGRLLGAGPTYALSSSPHGKSKRKKRPSKRRRRRSYDYDEDELMGSSSSEDDDVEIETHRLLM